MAENKPSLLIVCCYTFSFLYQIFKRTCDSLWFCPNVCQRHCFFEQRSEQIKRRSHKHPPSGHIKPVRKLPFLNRSIIALDYMHNQQFRRRICPPSVAVLSKNVSLSNTQGCTLRSGTDAAGIKQTRCFDVRQNSQSKMYKDVHFQNCHGWR